MPPSGCSTDSRCVRSGRRDRAGDRPADVHQPRPPGAGISTGRARPGARRAGPFRAGDDSPRGCADRRLRRCRRRERAVVDELVRTTIFPGFIQRHNINASATAGLGREPHRLRRGLAVPHDRELRRHLVELGDRGHLLPAAVRPTGQPPTGDHAYAIGFPAGESPGEHVDGYWSITLYSHPDVRLVPTRPAATRSATATSSTPIPTAASRPHRGSARRRSRRQLAAVHRPGQAMGPGHAPLPSAPRRSRRKLDATADDHGNLTAPALKRTTTSPPPDHARASNRIADNRLRPGAWNRHPPAKRHRYRLCLDATATVLETPTDGELADSDVVPMHRVPCVGPEFVLPFVVQAGISGREAATTLAFARSAVVRGQPPPA